MSAVAWRSTIRTFALAQPLGYGAHDRVVDGIRAELGPDETTDRAEIVAIEGSRAGGVNQRG